MRRAQLVALVFLMNCSSAFRAAKQGQEALDRGDVGQAMTHYGVACRESGDRDWCERAERLYLDYRAEVLAIAPTVCGKRGRERECFEVVNRARKHKDDPQLSAYVDASGKTWLTACQSIAVKEPVDAVLRARCVEAIRNEVDTSGYRQQANEERLTLAQFLATMARQAVDSKLTANALGLGGLARCLAPDVPVSASLDDLRAQLFSELAMRAAVAGDGLFSTLDVCREVDALTRSRIRCTTAGSTAGLRVSLARGPINHGFDDTWLEKTYIVRRDVSQNPEWVRLEAHRASFEHALQQARQNERLAADDCEQAQRELLRAHNCQNCSARSNEETYCRHAESLARFRRDAESDLSRADDALRRTNRELVTEVTDRYRWVRRTHTWSAQYAVTFVAAGLAFRSNDFVISKTHVQEEQQPFAPADVPHLIATQPDIAEWDGEARDEARHALKRWLNDALESMARTKELECDANQGPARLLECQARAAFLRGAEPAVDYGARLGKAAEARAAYPPVACASSPGDAG
jgi:hypothetical protein